MTFEPSPEQQARRAEARRFADDTLHPLAPTMDAGHPLPAAVQAAFDAQASALFSGGAQGGAMVVEEMAAACAAGAAVIGLKGAGAAPTGEGDDLPGLRGAGPWMRGAATFAVDAPARHLSGIVLAAVSVGIARAAVREAVDVLRRSGQRPGGDEATPHWLLADAATEADGASLLVLQAAGAVDGGGAVAADVALARVYAAEVAQRAVDAALRVAGPESFRPGSLIERLFRDSRSASLALAPLEHERTVAAAGLLPG